MAALIYPPGASDAITAVSARPMRSLWVHTHCSEGTMVSEAETQSLKSMGLMPWMWAAGLIALIGASVIVAAISSPAQPALLVGLAFAGAAAIELSAGIGLYRRGGAGISPLFSGASGLVMVAMLFFYWWLVPHSRSAGTVTMLFGIFCISTAIARALDVTIDRPVAPVSEAIASVTSLCVGVVALTTWQDASVHLSAWLVGIELMATALALSGAAWALWAHPELPGYDRPLPP